MVKNFSILLLSILFAVFVSCKQKPVEEKRQTVSHKLSPDSVRKIFEKELAYPKPNPNGPDDYLPGNRFTEMFLPLSDADYSEANVHSIKFYSYHLYGMEEMPIFDKPSDHEVYRFCWLRTFHPPVMVRFEKTKDSVLLTARLTDGAGGYNCGRVTQRIHKSFKEKEWNEFQKIITESNFMKMSSFEKGSELGLDGAEWLLEYKDKNNYHYVARWSPYRNGASEDSKKFAQSCLFLIKHLDIEFKETEIY